MKQQEKLIIIGGGITGLSAGLTWVKNMHVAQNPVTIFEKNANVGGYISTEIKDGFQFERQQFVPDIFDILNTFGIKIKMKQYQGVFAKLMVIDPITKMSKTYKIPASMKGFEYWLMNNYPEDIKRIKHFFAYIRDMYQELFFLKYDPGLIEKLKYQKNCRKIVSNKSKTFKQFVDSFKFSNREIPELLNTFTNFSGLSPDRVSCLLPIMDLNTILEGVFKPENGFAEIPEKFCSKFTTLGGEIKTNSTISEIIVENNKVKGVKTDDGKMHEADYVISTLDPNITFGNLTDPETVHRINPAYAKRIKEIKMSPSSIQINLGLDNKINLSNCSQENAYTSITTGNKTFSELFHHYDKKDFVLSDEKFLIGVICPFAGSGEKNVVSIRIIPATMSDWSELKKNNPDQYEEKKTKIADFFISLVEKHMIPNLKKHIVLKEVSTPDSFSDISGSPTGAIYGMAAYPDNFGLTRLQTKTPIEGLFQPQISHGILPSIQSGMQAIDIITQKRIMNGYWMYRKEFN